MARNIPDRFVRPLGLLASMPEEAYLKAIGDLSGETFLGDPEVLTGVLQNAQPGLSKSDAREVSLYLQAMAGIAVSPSHRDIDEVLAEMVLGDNLALSPSERELAKDRALGLVGCEAVQTLAFIMDSYWQHERPVADISVAVDIRPAFNADHELLAMTPWQTLLISYGGNPDTKSIEFSLDREDLESLKSQVDGALVQLAAVESRLGAAGIRVWSMKSETKEEGA